MKWTKYVVAAIFSLSIVFVGCSSSNKEKIHKDIQLELDALNKNAPIKINDNISFDSCSIDLNNNLNYYYSITDSVKPSDTFFNNIEQEVKNVVKKDPSMATLRGYEVSMKYIYRDINGHLLYSFDIIPSDYK